jgi:hypothetical protein
VPAAAESTAEGDGAVQTPTVKANGSTVEAAAMGPAAAMEAAAAKPAAMEAAAASTATAAVRSISHRSNGERRSDRGCKCTRAQKFRKCWHQNLL